MIFTDSLRMKRDEMTPEIRNQGPNQQFVLQDHKYKITATLCQVEFMTMIHRSGTIVRASVKCETTSCRKMVIY